MERITNTQVEEFLQNFKDRSETIILEEGKEKNDLIESARKRGIIISKNDRDLGVIKTIYCFTSKANSNKARLPKNEFIKIFPQIIGRPMDLGHNRQIILGFYIDYKYILKDETAIAYAIFFKGVYPKLWKKVKDFQKKKKLSSSYEIWSPEEKREYLSDGTYYLHDIGIAGGALIFEEYGEMPAFKDAKVLSIASKEIQESIDSKCLVYASKYKESEIIVVGDYFKKSVEENLKKIQEEKKGKEVKKAEPKVEVKPEEPKKEVKVEVTPKEKKVEPQINKIKCSNCGEEMDYNGIDVRIKCSKCFAILNKEGVMQYPPQIKDFRMVCPSCRVNNWLILANTKEIANLKCQNCSKEYKVIFATEKAEVKKALEKFSFLYTGRVNCGQCGTSNEVSGISNVRERIIKCRKCKMEFPFDITHTEYKKITNIQELNIDKIVKSSEKGGKKTMEFKLELSKYHRDVDDYNKLEATLPDDYGESTEVAKRLTTEQRNALPDSMFAVVVRVKDKRTGKMRKIRKFPINDEAHVRNALARLGQPAPQATLKKLGVSIESVKAKILRRARQLKMTTLLERYKSKVEKSQLPKEVTDCVKQKVKEGANPADAVKECWAEYKKTQKVNVEPSKVTGQSEAKEIPNAGKEKPKAKETPKAQEVPKPEDHSGKVKVKKETIEQAEKRITKTVIEETSKEIVTTNAETKDEALQTEIKRLTKLVAELEKKVELYKASAKKIIERKEELGDYAIDMKDEDLLDDLKYENASLKKKLAETPVEEKIETASEDIVGVKGKDNDFYTAKRKEITKKAFPENEQE